MKTKRQFQVTGGKREYTNIKQPIDSNIENCVVDENTSVFDCKYVPLKIKFRSNEEQSIHHFLKSKDINLNFLMITGLPGCGKTLIVSRLLTQYSNNRLIVAINAMTCKNYIEYITEVSKNLKFKLAGRGAGQIKTEFKNQILKLSTKQEIVLMIDEFDNLFKNNDKDSFDLFVLSSNPQIKIIGISNDIEFLQAQSKKFNLQMPNLTNIILAPYTQQQLSELVMDRLQEVNTYTIDETALKFLSQKAFNNKGGDMRNILDICKRVIRNKCNSTVLSKDDFNKELGDFAQATAFQSVVERFSLQQQIILVGLYLSLSGCQGEIELPNLIRKINEVKYRLSIQVELQIDEQLSMLQDYNLISMREQKQSKNGIKYTIRKITPKLKATDIQYYLHNIEAFQTILN